jgi:hypothetical protein
MGWKEVIVLLTGVTLLNTLIAGVFGMLVRQYFQDITDTAKKAEKDAENLAVELKDLKDQQLAGIRNEMGKLEQRMEGRIQKDSDARKALHEGLATVREEFMPRTICDKRHAELVQQREEFVGAVRTMSAIETKLASTAAFVQEVNERVIGAIQDLAHLKGAVGE